jgi:TPR repeat protein
MVVKLYEEAIKNLAMCYESSVGVECDMKKARDLYEQAK